MSGFTVEDVDAMQDEMNKIGEETSVANTETAEVPAKTAESKADEPVAKEETTVEKKEEESTDSKVKVESAEDIRELKEQLREAALALKQVTNDYQKLQKVMMDKGIITEDEAKEDKEKRDAAQAAFDARQEKLSEMVAIMEVNPQYADVREVCSQSNLDDIIDAFSRYYVRENGGKLADVSAKLSAEIWQEANPYKKIYELVKKYHPTYATVTDEKKETLEKVAKEADGSKKEKIPVNATPSAANMGTGATGSGDGGGAWTAAKIDALPEDELGTVPKAIYEKYLLGQLT
jgi:uncharacterized membrane-anchored protein YhcB (DUF1043 family)